MLLYLDNTFVPDLVEFRYVCTFTASLFALLNCMNHLVTLIQIRQHLAGSCQFSLLLILLNAL